MKTFEESDRYLYSLTPDSVVIDAGCNIGNWANLIAERYGCRILCFEPIREFSDIAAQRLVKYPKVQVFTLGVGGSNHDATFHWKGEMSGEYSEGCVSEKVHIRDIAEVMDEFSLKEVDLVKINIEGGEFSLLERILDADLAPRFKNLQVQWHSVAPKYRERRAIISARLSFTHEPTWGEGAFDNGWENWRLK